MDSPENGGVSSTYDGPDMQRVLVIVGAPRTGTHLVNGVLCASPDLPPLLPESGPVVATIEALRTSLAHHRNYPQTYYTTEQEPTGDCGVVLRRLVHRLCRRHGVEICVLRSPALTPLVLPLSAALATVDRQVRFICMVRDPRDAVASLRVWQQRRVDAGKPPSIAAPGDIETLARFHWSYYPPLLRDFEPKNREDVLFVRYEDLVADPSAEARRLGGFAGVDLSGFDPAVGWPRVVLDYPSRQRRDESVTPLFARPVSAERIGAWREVLREEEATAVLNACRPIVNRFYPEAARALTAPRTA